MTSQLKHVLNILFSFVSKHRLFSFLVFLLLCGITVKYIEENDPSESVPAVFSSVDANLLCRERYRNAALYDDDVCISCVTVKASDADGWVFYIDGKMQNVFGTWIKNEAYCTVNKNTHLITSFLLPDEIKEIENQIIMLTNNPDHVPPLEITKENDPSESVVVTNEKAEEACLEWYRHISKYGHDICISCTETYASKDSVDSDNYWLVIINGKMKNISGVWVEQEALCRFDKDRLKITSFIIPAVDRSLLIEGGVFSNARRK